MTVFLKLMRPLRVKNLQPYRETLKGDTKDQIHDLAHSITMLLVQIETLKVNTPERTVTAGSDVVQSGLPISDDFFQHLWPYIGNNTANVVFQMVKRLWLIRIDQ
ncbi:hypothetical protein TNCV_1932271 [Trichonephila clavipes]|nr:hypothetical protein TNCV_1932271 [Trichonephila clavipes]